eukprot:gb/GEZN01007461.1/.p1 GENE.gb/GEZN01007461.1/~~gb/GEZN01007461.1/.p1  ORF type:complete len:494 (+),score=69.84 gb/GEZN01007461.1/:26-1507(+)
MPPRRKKQKSLAKVRGLDDDDHSTGSHNYLPVVVDSTTSALCRNFLALSKEVGALPAGLFTPSEGSIEVFEVKHKAVENGEVLVEVIHRTEICRDQTAATTQARQDIENEVVKRQQDIGHLEEMVVSLQDRIREGGDDADSLVLELGNLLQVQGKHRKRIKELAALREVDVLVEVDCTIIRAELFVDTERQSTSKERMTVSLEEPCLYILGGWDSLEAMSRVEKFDRNTTRWDLVAPMSTERGWCAAAELNGFLFVLGGVNKAGASLSSVEMYDPANDSWEHVAPMVSRRSCCAAAVLNGKIFAIGGGSTWDSQTVERYDFATDRWEMLSPMSHKRSGCAAVVFEGELYVIGGNDGGEALASVERFDAKTNRWELMPPMTVKREGVVVAVQDGCIYAIGGCNSRGRLASVERFRSQQGEWELVAPLTCQRSYAAAAVLHGQIYVTGGVGGGGTTLSTLERFDMGKNAWELVDAPMTTARKYHTAVCGFHCPSI